MPHCDWCSSFCTILESAISISSELHSADTNAFEPAAADHMCAVFPRGARKNRTPTEMKYRSAEGKKRPPRNSCYLHELRGGLFHARICLRQHGTHPFLLFVFAPQSAKTNNDTRKSTTLPKAMIASDT
jgi:hypothetical protein